MFHSMSVSHFVNSPLDRHLGCFCLLAVVNSTALTSAVHVFVSAFITSGYITGSGIAGSHGSSVFNFLR